MSTAELPVTTEVASAQTGCPFCGAPSNEGQTFCPRCGQPGTPHALGTVLHRTYHIDALLSTSSTGAVYQVRDQRRKRDVAIKELIPPAGSSDTERAALAGRFVQQIKVLEHLRHPCLPELLGTFNESGRHYVVMTLLPGQNMQSNLMEHPQGYPERQVREWLRHLVNLLEYFEERHPQFIHGEIFPSHLMLRADGVPCLIGFALAPRLGLRPYLELPGQKNPAVVAPATTKKHGKSGPLHGLSTRDDIYGLGASLHSLFTGRDVFAGYDYPGRPFPPVRDLAPRVSAGVAEVVNRAIDHDPAKRYPSALGMRATLAPLLGNTPPAGLKAPAATASSGRDRRVLPLIAVVVLLLIAAIVAVILRNQSNNTQTVSPPTPIPIATAGVVAGPPTPAHTLPIADAFIRSSRVWPATKRIYRQGADLWIDNTAGPRQLKAARIGYSTGSDGFTLRATLRQVHGPAGAAYGIIAADKPTAKWENIALLIRGTGQWSVVRNHSGHATTLVAWRQSLQLRLGHNSPNEVQLSMVPGKDKRHGTFVVTINGQRMSADIPAWSTAPFGRVGIEASPGTQIVCDGLSVGPLTAKPPAMEDHFLDNRLGWSSNTSNSAAPVLTNSELRLQTNSKAAWNQASAPAYKILSSLTTFDLEAMIGMNSANGTPIAGGLVFARTSPPKAKAHKPKPPAAVALAAVIDSSGRVSVVQLTTGKNARTIFGPISSPRVRTGYGLNLLRVHEKRQGELLHIAITLNGGAPIKYSTGMHGLLPASGVAAVGADATVSVSALRLYH
jgi:serine/threonine protein kinase